MKRTICTLALLLAFGTLPAWAQSAAPTASQGNDPLDAHLFPPELVMQYHEEIGLTKAQRSRIKEEAIAAQQQFASLQWDLQEAMLDMKSLVQNPRVDEAAALSQLDRILDAEREVKRTQLALALRIKNILTPEQQQQLTTLRQLSRQGQHGIGMR